MIGVAGLQTERVKVKAKDELMEAVEETEPTTSSALSTRALETTIDVR